MSVQMEELRHFELRELRGLGRDFLHFRDEKTESWVTDKNSEAHSREKSTTQRKSFSKVPLTQNKDQG